jgi:cysteine-rich repeat protein
MFEPAAEGAYTVSVDVTLGGMGPADTPFTLGLKTDTADVVDCTPTCGTNQCGDNGCGGSCGDCSGTTPHCDATGQCVATTTCGDGVIDAGEDCDDGNAAAGDGCDASCQVETDWVCTGEPSVCTLTGPTCGDSSIEVPEACDDGNAAIGDGCSDLCQLETGYDCTGEPSRCIPTPICGDGIVAVTEDCDDLQNPPVSGDGCSATCTIEAGYECTPGLPCTKTRMKLVEENIANALNQYQSSTKSIVSRLIVVSKIAYNLKKYFGGDSITPCTLNCEPATPEISPFVDNLHVKLYEYETRISLTDYDVVSYAAAQLKTTLTAIDQVPAQ